MEANHSEEVIHESYDNSSYEPVIPCAKTHGNYGAAAATPDAVEAVADIHVLVVDEGRFPSLPRPAARSDSSMVYADSLSARQRFLCTLLLQCERSAVSVS